MTLCSFLFYSSTRNGLQNFEIARSLLTLRRKMGGHGFDPR
jgi:hypothetical protein